MRFIGKYSLFVFLLTLCYTDTATATVYECKAKQEFEWIKGNLEPNSQATMIFEFDDQDGILSVAANSNVDGYSQPLHIYTPLSSLHDLEANSIVIINGHFAENNYFRISSSDKSVGLVFIYSSGETMASGNCNIDNTIKSLPTVDLVPSEKILPSQEDLLKSVK